MFPLASAIPPVPAQEALRREIAVGERLLFVARAGSTEAVVAADGRVRLPNGERVPAVRRTLAELSATSWTPLSVRRLACPNAGFPLLGGPRILRVPDGTSLLDAVRGLPPVEEIVVFDRTDRSERLGRAAFATRRLAPGDALLLGSPAPLARATVVGGVTTPGAYDVVETSTLATLLSAAGGLASRGRSGGIVVERAGTKLGPYALPADGATPIRAGDLVRVPVGVGGKYVTIAGAVRRPGLIEVVPEMTVQQAIDAAGGLTLPVDALLVSLRSITDPKRKSVRAKASELNRFPTLKAGDLLEIAPPPRRSQ